MQCRRWRSFTAFPSIPHFRYIVGTSVLCFGVSFFLDCLRLHDRLEKSRSLTFSRIKIFENYLTRFKMQYFVALPSFLNLGSSSTRRPFRPLVPNIFKANRSEIPKSRFSGIFSNCHIVASSKECQDTVFVSIFRRCHFQISFE